MSDQYTPQTPNSSRPTIAGAGLDPLQPEYRGNTPTYARGDGGFSTGILVAIVFVVVAIIAAAVFSNRDMFGIGLGVTPASDTRENSGSGATDAPATGTGATTGQTVDAPAQTTIDPVAPTPVPADPVTPQPADPVQPPVQAPATNP